jgi:hypothetical protein
MYRHTDERLSAPFILMQNISEGHLAGTGRTFITQGFAVVKI